MQGQGVLVRAARLGISAVARLCQPAPSVTGIRHMVLYDERERGEELVHFRKEDERLLRKLLSKVKAQADAVDKSGADGHKDEEMTKLKAILPKHNLTDEEFEKLLAWKHSAGDV